MDFNNNWLNDYVEENEWNEDNNTIIDDGDNEAIIFPILYNEFLS